MRIKPAAVEQMLLNSVFKRWTIRILRQKQNIFGKDFTDLEISDKMIFLFNFISWTLLAVISARPSAYYGYSR